MQPNTKLVQHKCPQNDFFARDIWYASELGLRVSQSRYENKFNFSNIKQSWFKENVKRFIQYRAVNSSFSNLLTYLTTFNCFSKFFYEIGYLGGINTLSRSVMLDYIDYLNRSKISSGSKADRISHLAIFFETGTTNSWFKVPSYLIRQEDYPKKTNTVPRYIPEEVIQQLNQHLNTLPPSVMRMVLVIQECGLRVGELCQLPFDCLKQDTKGGWFIQFMRWKMKKETTLPISLELSKVILEQQQYIRESLGTQYNYLFSARNQYANKEFIAVPKVMSGECFVDYLKKLAQNFEIRDNSGKRWDFQSHQFRHTVGTRMINNGVPQHIIQRYLGHESPQMTMVYAHIHDRTLRKEVEKYHESRVVNFQGETSELDETILSSSDDLEWFKKNVQARALEHGYCARPKVLGDCDIPGFDGCYNCPHWRTNKNFLPVLKDTLERTNKVLSKAQSCGWELQINKNKPIKENLEKVIRALEEDNNEQED